MSKDRIIKNGQMTRIIEAETIGDVLPVRNYAIGYRMDLGFFLTDREPFQLPEKIYGGESNFSQRVLDTYKARGRGMGVLLSGPKGTGKTVEAKQICIKSERPVLLLGSAYAGDNFSSFIESIKTPSVIFIDEFEKVYQEEEHRNFFLTLMDGVSASRHLFVLTSNQTRIGEYFESRPGRIRYHKRYGHLDDTIIESIIRDKLKDQTKVEEVIKQISRLQGVSVDSVTSIIEECNIHDEVPSDFMDVFNVKSERPTIYRVSLETMGWAPKAGIARNKLNRAREIVRFANDNSYNFEEDFPEWVADRDKLCENAKRVYTSEYSQPFRNSGGSQDRPNLYCTYLSLKGADYESGGGYQSNSTSINWQFHDLKSFEETRAGFTAVHRDGSILTGTPSESSSKDYTARFENYD